MIPVRTQEDSRQHNFLSSFRQACKALHCESIVVIILLSVGIMMGEASINYMYSHLIENSKEHRPIVQEMHSGIISERKFDFSEESELTVVLITCCNQHQFLQNTISSFYKTNSYPLRDFYVLVDGMVTQSMARIVEPYGGIKLLTTGKHRGRVETLDFFLSEILDTEYYFLTGDHWSFQKDGMIKSQVSDLQSSQKILQVQKSDDSKAVESTADPSKLFNPSVNRASDFPKIKQQWEFLGSSTQGSLGNDQKIETSLHESNYEVAQSKDQFFVDLKGKN